MYPGGGTVQRQRYFLHQKCTQKTARRRIPQAVPTRPEIFVNVEQAVELLVGNLSWQAAAGQDRTATVAGNLVKEQQVQQGGSNCRNR